MMCDVCAQFDVWFKAAVGAGINLPTAMCLSTVGEQSQPNARFVLLKGYDSQGFVFYSNR